MYSLFYVILKVTMYPRTYTTVVAFLITGVIIAGWIYVLNTSPTSRDETVSSPLQSITVRHQYDEGEHRYFGSINVPTPCYSLISQAVVHLELEPDEVMLNLTTSADTEECEPEVTSKIFFITFKAEKNALIAATLNSEKILLETIEVEEEESVVLIQ